MRIIYKKQHPDAARFLKGCYTEQDQCYGV